MQALKLQRNNLALLPESIFSGAMNELIDVDLSHNLLTTLPNLSALSKVVSFNVCRNQLTVLPESFTMMTELHELHIAGNRIAALPDIAPLDKLEVLNAAFNCLTSLPDSIAAMYNLRVLSVAYNQLTSLPNMTELFALEELFVSGNPQLGSLPESISSASSLATIFAANVGLKSLPDEIASMPALAKLDVSHNQLTTLPSALSSLLSLESLNASFNRIESVPIAMGDLYALVELNLSGNMLANAAALPEDYERLVDREVDLLLDFNPGITSVPGQQRRPMILSKRFTYGASEMIGRRPTQEDEIAVCGAPFAGSDTMDYFGALWMLLLLLAFLIPSLGVFDGHAGRVAASYCAEHVSKVLEEAISKGAAPSLALLKSTLETVNESFRLWLARSAVQVKQVGTW